MTDAFQRAVTAHERGHDADEPASVARRPAPTFYDCEAPGTACQYETACRASDQCLWAMSDEQRSNVLGRQALETHAWAQALGAWCDLRDSLSSDAWRQVGPHHGDGAGEADLAMRALGQAVRERLMPQARSEAQRLAQALHRARDAGRDTNRPEGALRALLTCLDQAVMAEADRAIPT